jgi:hypothetical protein
MMERRSATSGNGAQNLVRFIEQARERKMSHEMIRQLLLSGGWKDREICNQLAAVELGLPIPLARGKGGAREAFFYLTAFTCLYVSAVAFVLMVFNLIDVAIPDATHQYWNNEWSFSTIRSALSALVVFFPLYLVFLWLIHRDTVSGKTVAGGGVERWLTYLTLFVIVLTMLVDASTLLYWMLEGEATMRLLLKAVSLFAVMCGVFAWLWTGNMKWFGITKGGSADGRD